MDKLKKAINEEKQLQPNEGLEIMINTGGTNHDLIKFISRVREKESALAKNKEVSCFKKNGVQQFFGKFRIKRVVSMSAKRDLFRYNKKESCCSIKKPGKKEQKIAQLLGTDKSGVFRILNWTY